MQAAVYVRISADREGRELGVARQEEDCRDLAARLHLKVYRVYSDNDISASTRSRKVRPEYQKLLADAKAGQFSVILAYTSSRITRKPRENEDLIELGELYGVRFDYVRSPSFDLNTANGRMVARMLAAADTNEAEQTAERVARAAEQRAKEGQFHGGGRPYGYEADGITIRESEAQVVRDCAKRIIAGESQASIIRWLNDTGRLTGTGKRWMIGNLYRTITKKRYIGIREYIVEGKPVAEYPAVWPAIITREDHELILARFKESAQPWNHGPLEGRSYLLSGMAFCGTCGSAMYGQARKVEGGKQRRYRCRPYDNHSVRVGCGKVFRDATALDAFVTEAVLTRFDSPQVAAALAAQDSQDEARALSEELIRLRVRRKDIARKLALADDEDLSIMLETVRDAIEQTQNQLSKLQANKAAILPREPLREAWERASLEWKRDIIRLIVERIVVNPVTGPSRPMWRDYRLDIDLIDIAWVH